MKRTYYLLDVFTQTALAGNPLAVVTESTGLDDERMQQIAREFNLSETVFVFEPKDPVKAASLRIFTTTRELPFAGHPTVGTAALLAHLRAPEYLSSREVGVVVEEKIGTVSCTVRRLRAGALVAHFDLPTLPVPCGTPPSKAQIAAALGLAEEDIGFDNHAPSLFSAGLPTTLVPIRNISAIARATPNLSLLPDTFGDTAAYLYTNETTDKANHLHARMFGSALGVFEDPATGASAAALAGALMAFGSYKDGSHTLHIEQGVEMGRPSLILLDLHVQGGSLQGAAIGGPVVIVAQGTLDI